MQVSEEAKQAAQSSVRNVGVDFETASNVADLAVGNAPIASPAIDAFHLKWSNTVTAHLQILEATATALAVVADSLIATDAAMAGTLTPTSGPR